MAICSGFTGSTQYLVLSAHPVSLQQTAWLSQSFDVSQIPFFGFDGSATHPIQPISRVAAGHVPVTKKMYDIATFHSDGWILITSLIIVTYLYMLAIGTQSYTLMDLNL